MNSLSRFLTACMVIPALLVAAQPKTPPSWRAAFETPIAWQRVHSLGYLLVDTRDALYGVHPDNGKILWKNEAFASLSPEAYQEVDGTEFVTITYAQETPSAIPLQAIIHVATGKVLFDSDREQIGVLSRHVLPESGRLLVIGMKPKTFSASLFMYDIASGKQLWSNDDLFKTDAAGAKGFLGKLQAIGQQLDNLKSLTSEPLELGDGTVVITHPNFVIRLNTTDGKVIWKNAITPSIGAQIHFSPYQEGVLYVGTDVESESGSGFTTSSQQGEPQKFHTNLYYAFDLASGKPLWKEPAKENDMLNLMIMDERGIIICPRSSQKPTINLINYQTGETMWGKKGKGIKAQGSVVSYIPTDEGLLITTAFDNAWNNKAEEYYLNILDPDGGTLRYEKSIKLKGDLVRTELLPKGLLFITTRELNILNTNSGSLLWPGSIEAGSAFNSDVPRPFPVGDAKDGKLFVYSPKEKAVFEIDKRAGAYKKMTPAEIEFEGKEMPKVIDVVDDGLVLSSDQNIMKIGYDGLVKYYRYYPAPRQPALMRALLAAQAVRAAYIGAAASAYSVAFAEAASKSTDATGKAVGQELSQGFGALGKAGFAYSAQALKDFNARFKASMNAPSFVMMMTKQEDKGIQLIQVSKENGQITSAVDIKNDREPEYDVDQVYNYVYYRSRPSEIACYKL